MKSVTQLLCAQGQANSAKFDFQTALCRLADHVSERISTGANLCVANTNRLNVNDNAKRVGNEAVAAILS